MVGRSSLLLNGNVFVCGSLTQDVYHFQLPHGRPQDLRWYHTKFRPRTEEFLEKMSKLFELHICTFGVRSYAHTIARFLDPDRKYFQQRILSRDECFHPTLKTSNLKYASLKL